MKRSLLLLNFLIALAILLAACAPAAPAAAPEGPAVLTDATGAQFTLEKPAQRIISLAASNTEILFALGAGAQLVGREEFSNYPAEAANVASVGGSMGNYNMEEIARLQPDLILASPLTPPEGIASLKEITPNVFVLGNPKSLDELYANLNTVGKLTGREAEATAMVQNLTARAEAVLSKVAPVTEKPKVFYELDATDPSKPYTAGPGSFVDMLIGLAGGQNLGGSLSGEWAQISQEALIVENPDIILLGDSLYGGITPESVAARPGWNVVNAVKNGKTLPFNDDLVSRPGPRMIDGLEEMAKIFHPDLFK